jgi:hypothetical protein
MFKNERFDPQSLAEALASVEVIRRGEAQTPSDKWRRHPIGRAQHQGPEVRNGPP